MCLSVCLSICMCVYCLCVCVCVWVCVCDISCSCISLFIIVHWITYVNNALCMASGSHHNNKTCTMHSSRFYQYIKDSFYASIVAASVAGRNILGHGFSSEPSLNCSSFFISHNYGLLILHPFSQSVCTKVAINIYHFVIWVTHFMSHGTSVHLVSASHSDESVSCVPCDRYVWQSFLSVSFSISATVLCLLFVIFIINCPWAKE